MRSSFLFLAGVASTVVVVASCSSSSDSGTACTEYKSTIDLQNPQVSMKTNVMPILQQSCMFSSCHGGGSGKITMTSGDSTKTRAALVDVPAPEMPSMKIVATGDPSNSWLMKKVDGDVCLFKGKCVDDPNCADTMPQGNDLLDVGSRDVIRRWIAQGAKDN